MEYSRTGAEYGTNIKYFIDYNNPSQSTGIIEANVEIRPIDPDRPHEFELNLPPGGRKDLSDGDYEVVLDFNQSEEGWIEIKNTAGDNPRSSKKLEVPPPMVFEICRTIVEGHGFFGQESWMKEQYSTEREGYHLIEFSGQSEKILKFRDHIKVLSFLADQHPRVANVLAENSLGYFTNRVVKASKPQSVTSFSDLKFKLDIYNDQDFLSIIDINEVLRDSLDQIYISQRNSGFEYVKNRLFRILPEADEAKYLSRNVCSMYLSCLLDGSKNSRAEELFYNWISHSNNNQGECAAEINQLETSFAQTGSLSDSDFGEYLYYVGFNQVKSGSGLGTLPLFEVSSQLLSDDNSLSNIAKFWSRFSLV